jgi:TPR repeat protein
MFAMLAFLLVLVQAPGAAAPQDQSAPQSRATLSAAEIAQLQSEAEAGYAGSQLALGRAYQDGNGVKQNDELAVNWYRKAADQGNATAQNDLGIMYRAGSGVEKSKEEAVNWYRKAAKQGNGSAMFNLGAAYYNGDGLQIDDVSAFAWFLLAKDAGSKAAVDAVERSEAEMKPWGSASAVVKIAEMYGTGQNLDSNPGEAAKWYRKAADMNVPSAQVHLAQLLIDGRGVTQDYTEARHWCQVAADQHDPAGMYCIARLYQDGIGVPKDTRLAAKWFLRSAELGSGSAMWQLGEMYWKGNLGKPDRVTAYMWMLLAFSSRIPPPRQDAASLRKEMSESEAKKAMGKARAFLRDRPFFELRTPESDVSTARAN